MTTLGGMWARLSASSQQAFQLASTVEPIQQSQAGSAVTGGMVVSEGLLRGLMRAHAPDGEVQQLLAFADMTERDLEDGIVASGGVGDTATTGQLSELPTISQNVELILQHAVNLCDELNLELDKLVRIRDLLGGILLTPEAVAYHALEWVLQGTPAHMGRLPEIYSDFLRAETATSLKVFLDANLASGEVDARADGAISVLRGHEGEVNWVAVTPERGRAVSASDDHTLRVWDLATGATVRQSAAARATHGDMPLDRTGIDGPDHLRYRVYASAIYQLITHRDTSLPLSIGVSAPWGAGKTSIMRWVQYELERHRTDLAHQCRVSTVSDWETASARHAAKHAAEAQGLVRRFRTVWIDAWRFEESAALWAAFTKEIYRQGQGQLTVNRWWKFPYTSLQRMKFRLALANRVSPAPAFVWWDRIKARIPLWRRRKSVPGIWWPSVIRHVLQNRSAVLFLIVGSVIGFLVSLVANLVSDSDVASRGAGIGAGLITGIPAAFAAAKGWLRQPFSFDLDKVLSARKEMPQPVDPVTAPDDIWRLISLLAPGPEDGLAVFIDDLDRCSPDKVKDAIEAINLLFAAASAPIGTHVPNVVFVLGMDAEMVAASIRVAYGPTVEELGRRDKMAAEEFGHRFLTKIVQISFEVPDPHEDLMKVYVDSLLDLVEDERSERSEAGTDEAPSQPDPARYTEIDREVQEAINASSTVSDLRNELVNRSQAKQGLEQMRFLSRAERALEFESVHSLSKDSPEVGGAIRKAAPILSPRPRDYKRFVNAVRLQMLVSMRLTHIGEGRRPASAEHLAKWTALCMRWPLLVHEVRRDPMLLDALEDWAAGYGFGERQRVELISSLMEDTQFRQTLKYPPSLKGIDLHSMLIVH